MATLLKGDSYTKSRSAQIPELETTDTIIIISLDGRKKEIAYADLLTQLSAAISAGSGKTTRQIYKNQILLDN